jgi:transposase
MKRFVEGEDRTQGVLLPEFLDDYVAEDNSVRAIDVFVDELDLRALGFEGVVPEATGRPAYHPATMLKIYVYGYINQVQSSRRLERETARNVEMMWLTGRLVPDFKTIADFRKDNGSAIRSACRQFVAYKALEVAVHAAPDKQISLTDPDARSMASGRRVGGSQVGAAEGQDRRAARADAQSSVEIWTCSPTRSWRSTAAGSRPATPATGPSRAAR